MEARSKAIELLRNRHGTKSRAELSIEDAREVAIQEIDRQAEAARQTFISPGDGQAMSYLEKTAQAERCLEKHDMENQPEAGDFPLLESEIGVMADTVVGVAKVVLAARDGWVAVEAAINRTRVVAKAAVRAAASEAEIDGIMADLGWAIQGVD